MRYEHVHDGLYQPVGTHTYELIEVTPEYSGDAYYQVRCIATQRGFFSKKPKTVIGYIKHYSEISERKIEKRWSNAIEPRTTIDIFRNHREYKETVIYSCNARIE